VPDAVVPALLEAFGLERRRHVHLVGGGGKTTLMFAAARALAAAGRTVLTTTSTRILWPGPGESECVVQGAAPEPLLARLRGEFARRRHVTAVGGEPGDGRKVTGLPLETIDALVAARVADHVLVEADGSAGRPLKAHAAHEPVVSAGADLVIVVVGATCLGAPLDDAHVHRAALLRERLGLAAGARVSPADVAGILFHPHGWLERVAAATEVVVFVNQADSPGRAAAARDLAAAIRGHERSGRLARVVVGDVRGGVFEVAG
jgi:probable selenium-dependent hydroxylase accessory protein YqeC